MSSVHIFQIGSIVGIPLTLILLGAIAYLVEHCFFWFLAQLESDSQLKLLWEWHDAATQSRTDD